jgi:hypothetical protein
LPSRRQPSWAPTRCNCSCARGARQGGSFTPAASASRSFACRSLKAVLRLLTKSAGCRESVPAGCAGQLRVGWRRQPVCRCGCRPWCAQKYLDFPKIFPSSFFAAAGHRAGQADQGEEDAASDASTVVADKLPLTLDKSRRRQAASTNCPRPYPQDLLLEATYADPNGEVQTMRSTHTLWPAGGGSWHQDRRLGVEQPEDRFQALALDLSGKPQADVRWRSRPQHASPPLQPQAHGGWLSTPTTTRPASRNWACLQWQERYARSVAVRDQPQ